MQNDSHERIEGICPDCHVYGHHTVLADTPTGALAECVACGGLFTGSDTVLV